tara:strand:+ start:762 stop:2540 length:1779 start_codon:yes stop_codon:yes gene_type:complete
MDDCAEHFEKFKKIQSNISMIKKNILGVILARAGSKGIKKKNIKNLCGHPLISYSIYAGIQSKLISKLIVSTDSNEIAKVSEDYGAEIPFIRPKHLAKDNTWSRDALKHAVIESENFYKKQFDYIVEIPAVAPLRTGIDIDQALKKLIKTQSDSVIGMTQVFDKHPIRMKRIINGNIIDYDPKKKEGESSRRQELKPCFVRNGAIYAMRRNTIVNNFSRVGKISKPYLMDNLHSINIDEISDFYTVEKIVEKGLCKNKPFKKFVDNKIHYINSQKRNTILISYPKIFFSEFEKKLLNKFNIIFCDINNIGKINKKLINNIIAWIVPTNGLNKIGKKYFDHFSALKYLISPATGLTHIDLDSVKKKNIKLIKLDSTSETKKIYASSEYAMLLLLATIRKLRKAIKIVDQSGWRDQESIVRGNELSNFKFGIFGYGRIGKNVMKYLGSMNSRPHIYDPFKKNKSKKVKQYKNIKEFLQKTDCLIICASLNKENYNYFNLKKLKMLRKNSVIINIARGELINEKDLVRLMKNKHISAFGTDVVSNESKILEGKNILLQYAKKNDNVLISPHIAGLTYESETKAIKIVLKKINNLL